MKEEDPVALSLLSRSIRTYSPSSASHGIPQRPKLTTATLTALAPAGGTLPDAPAALQRWETPANTSDTGTVGARGGGAQGRL